MVNIIVAIAENGVIGGDNTLLWHISEDLKNFKRITSGHPVIMGRKTYESLGRPLPNRENVVITRSDIEIEGCRVAHSLEQAISLFTPAEQIFIIGGAQIYAEALTLADRLYITRVHRAYEGDTSFPEWDQNEWVLSKSEHFERGAKFEYPYRFEDYRRVRNSQLPYQITQVTADAIPLIRELAVPCFLATYRDIVSPEQNEYMVDMMYSTESLAEQFREGQQFYIIHDNGTPIGYLSLHPISPTLVHLEKLYINQSAQGKGYGKILIEFAFEEVKRLCAGKPCRVELNVNRHNRAVDFYFKLGLKVAESGDYQIEGTPFIRPDYILYKEL